MNIQEIEEMQFGDGFSNESERLFAWEKMTEGCVKVNRKKVNELSSYGFCVVIAKFAIYGSNTDAFLGYSEYVERVTRSLTEAQYLVKAFENDYHEDILMEIVYPERG